MPTRRWISSIFARRPDQDAARAGFAATMRKSLARGVGNRGQRWTQEGVAAAVGVGKDAVANWVNGRAVPNEVSFGLVVRTFEVDGAEDWERTLVADLRRHWKNAQEESEASPAIGWRKHAAATVLAAAITATATIASAVLIYIWSGPDQTREYLKLFEDSGHAVGQARKRISERLWQIEDLIATMNALIADPQTAAEAAVHRENLIQLLARGDGTHAPLAPDIHELVLFFEQVANCIDARLCDPDTAETMLGDHAATFWLNWKTFILDRRELQAKYGGGAERVAALARKDG